MANSKISALTSATTPLAGTETLPVVQSSTTKQVSVANLTAGRTVSALSLTSTNDSSINGVNVGKGAGSVASNTSLGVSALAGNSTGSRMTAVGYRSMVGATGNYNAAFGSNTFESLTSGTNGTAIGDYALQQTTGSFNTAIGNGSGYLITSGSKNTILGIYSGNQNGLNITTSSNYVVLSDGDGTPRAYHNGTDWVYPTGNLVPGTAAKGVNFTANTPAAGKTSQLLNWYEEGTWTMGLSFGGGTTGITYVVNTGRYIRIGKSVTVTGLLILSSKGSSTGAVKITGLPFSIGAGNESQSAGAIRLGNSTFTGQYAFTGSIGTTTIDGQVDNGVTGTAASLTNTNFANNSLIQISYTYFVD